MARLSQERSRGLDGSVPMASAYRNARYAAEVVRDAAAKVGLTTVADAKGSAIGSDDGSATVSEQWGSPAAYLNLKNIAVALVKTNNAGTSTGEPSIPTGDILVLDPLLCSNLSITNSSAVDPRSIMLNLSDCGMDSTEQTYLPPDMTFDEDNLMSVIVYCLLFLVAAVGNLTVFLTLFRNRHRKSRVNLFIMHLSLADLIVTFIMLPLETIWHITVAWKAGDVACRLLMFFRAFGLYLSSFILVVISLDRYFAILHPLSMSDAEKRGKLMLIMAWLFSVIASLPQVGDRFDYRHAVSCNSIKDDVRIYR